jgi:hypothetical protein
VAQHPLHRFHVITLVPTTGWKLGGLQSGGCGDLSAEREFPSDKVYRRDDCGVLAGAVVALAATQSHNPHALRTRQGRTLVRSPSNGRRKLSVHGDIVAHASIASLRSLTSSSAASAHAAPNARAAIGSPTHH